MLLPLLWQSNPSDGADTAMVEGVKPFLVLFQKNPTLSSIEQHQQHTGLIYQPFGGNGQISILKDSLA